MKIETKDIKRILATTSYINIMIEFELKDNEPVFKKLYKKPNKLDATIDNNSLENFDDEDKYYKIVYEYFDHADYTYNPDTFFVYDNKGNWCKIEHVSALPHMGFKYVVESYKPEIGKNALIKVISNVQLSIDSHDYNTEPELRKVLNINEENDYTMDELKDLYSAAKRYRDQNYL